tara:strand:+ start:38480 stop:39136 length:657 start_codon:yes stop_codon:yes gene_type:complete
MLVFSIFIIYITLITLFVIKKNKIQVKAILSLLIVISSISVYFLTGGTKNLAYLELNKKISEYYLASEEKKEEKRGGLEYEIKKLVSQNDLGADQLYSLASKLRIESKFNVANLFFESLIRQKNFISSEKVFAEYAQNLYLSRGAKFSPKVEILLNRSLEINPNNAPALTLKGLKLIDENKYEESLNVMNKAYKYLNSEADKRELAKLIELINKRKNQ